MEMAAGAINVNDYNQGLKYPFFFNYSITFLEK